MADMLFTTCDNTYSTPYCISTSVIPIPAAHATPAITRFCFVILFASVPMASSRWPFLPPIARLEVARAAITHKSANCPWESANATIAPVGVRTLKTARNTFIVGPYKIHDRPGQLAPADPASKRCKLSQNFLRAPLTSGPSHHWVIYVFLAFFGGLLTFAGARAQQKASDDTTFRKLIDGYCAAWSSGNAENASKFYAKDDHLVFYDVAPFSYSGWKEYDAGARKNFLDSTESVSLTAGQDLRVTRHGIIAWTTVPMHLTVKLKFGRTIDTPVRYTGIWEKHGNSWFLVHEHLSAPYGG
jgi:ketosteroid isomerase-like protein